jgi:hypothetical protein
VTRFLTLAITHLAFAAGGFALGIYALPILMAPDAPSSAEVAGLQSKSAYSGEFRRDLADSDILHWGEGTVYLSPEFVETENDFMALKSSMVQVGPVKTFENFIVPLPEGIDPSSYNTVIIWCEAFGQFITAAQYQ